MFAVHKKRQIMLGDIVGKLVRLSTESNRRFLVSFVLFLIILVSGAPDAHAENGDGCPEGYVFVSAPYQTTGPNGQPVMVQNTGCSPIPVQYYWGAVAYATVNGRIYASAYWNAYSERVATKNASADCKKYLQNEGIKGRCRIAGSGRNGTWSFAAGADLSLYFGWDDDESLNVCRRTTTDCRLYASLRTDGSEDSGVRWFE